LYYFITDIILSETRQIDLPSLSIKKYLLVFARVTGGWRKLHNEVLHSLYSSPSIIRMIKPRRMRWAGHVARMEEKRNAYRILVGKPEGKRPLEDQDVGGLNPGPLDL
jgi:hypothetical protein